MILEQLRDRCAYWQKVLRLQDWDIRLSLVRQWDVPSAFGTSQSHLDKKIAKVKILEVIDDGDPNDFEEYDQETTLVHELLHVHFAAFSVKDDEHAEIAQHQVIQALSYALIKLDRARFGEPVVIPKNGAVVLTETPAVYKI